MWENPGLHRTAHDTPLGVQALGTPTCTWIKASDAVSSRCLKIGALLQKLWTCVCSPPETGRNWALFSIYANLQATGQTRPRRQCRLQWHIRLLRRPFEIGRIQSHSTRPYDLHTRVVAQNHRGQCLSKSRDGFIGSDGVHVPRDDWLSGVCQRCYQNNRPVKLYHAAHDR